MLNDHPTSTNNGLSTPAQFRSKLGTYLSGVIIGLIMLGSIYFMKYLATKEQQNQPQGTDTALPTPQESTP
ncbi:MAG: hypothetical protein ACWA5W_00790 [Phycisphaerales bacterium]